MATVATQATPTVTVGGSIADTATVTGTSGAAAPTGTVTFTAFGPDDATCAGPPAFTTAPQPLAPGSPGPPPTATASSGPFTPTSPGAYRWIATYNGDAAYPPVTTACNDANETSVVTQGSALIVTIATPTAPLGTPISDAATVTGIGGAAAPTGTVTFTAFGPDDATCAGPPAFTSAPQPLTPAAPGPPPTATAGSGPFTPGAPGTYRWIGAYSGDATYSGATSTCNDAGETSLVTGASIATQATPTAAVGGAISDTATVTGTTGALPPLGTVTFTAFGPDDATCAARQPS